MRKCTNTHLSLFSSGHVLQIIIFYICYSIDKKFAPFSLKFCNKYFSTLLCGENFHVLKACIFLGICKSLIRAAKRLHFLFRTGRGRPDSGGRCSALTTGSSSLFPFGDPSRPSPRKCSPGPGRRRDFERSGCGAGCGADPEPRDLRTCSVFAMRLLGAAFASAVGRGPLPRVPAALGWRGKQVSVPGEARQNRGGPGPGGPRGRVGAAPLPSPAPPLCLC